MRTQSNGEAIRRLREEKGLTLTKLAEAADISPAHMCRLENGDRYGSLRIRQQIAAALGTNVTAISKAVPRPTAPDKAAA